jgi:uncharacterized SAM-binding protein YcdF (DUF218 family)
MPPGLMLVMMATGTVLVGRFYRTGRWLIIGGFVLLLLSSLRIVSDNLLRLLEQTPPVDLQRIVQADAQAIVVLGGGRYANAPELAGQDTVSAATLERLNHAVRLHRQSGLPLLVTGGSPYARPHAEAELMQRSLQEEYRVPVRWVEDRSRNTWENARFSHDLLAAEDIRHIVLVTHAWHMPRSRIAFEQTGFSVLPAPLAYTRTDEIPLLLQLIPDARAVLHTRIAMREALGRMWYAIRQGRGTE